MDWLTRKVLAWRIPSTLDADFCVEALNEAIHRFDAAEIMDTDHGSQFTSFAWTGQLNRVGARISIDGKGRCLDNPRVFLWTEEGGDPVRPLAGSLEPVALAARCSDT